MKVRKATVFLLMLAMIMGLLVACQSGGNNEPAAEEPADEEAEKPVRLCPA